ncbi:MAG: hypothetical protein WCT37_05115 [Patescibacteria group bacterium]
MKDLILILVGLLVMPAIGALIVRLVKPKFECLQFSRYRQVLVTGLVTVTLILPMDVMLSFGYHWQAVWAAWLAVIIPATVLAGIILCAIGGIMWIHQRPKAKNFLGGSGSGK